MPVWYKRPGPASAVLSPFSGAWGAGWRSGCTDLGWVTAERPTAYSPRWPGRPGLCSSQLQLPLAEIGRALPAVSALDSASRRQPTGTMRYRNTRRLGKHSSARGFESTLSFFWKPFPDDQIVDVLRDHRSSLFARTSLSECPSQAVSTRRGQQAEPTRHTLIFSNN